MAEARERTFIMIKPDGVQRGLVGKIIKKFEQKGFKLVAMKFMWVSNNSHINAFYIFTLNVYLNNIFRKLYLKKNYINNN